MTFRANVSRVDRALIWQDYDYYRGKEGGHCETECAAAGSDVDFDALFEKDFFDLKLVTQGVLQKMRYLQRVP